MDFGLDDMRWLQHHSYLLSLSGYSPDLLIGGRGAEVNFMRWQYAVNFIHSGLLSGVLGLHSADWLAGHGMDLRDFIAGISTNSPFDPDFFNTAGPVYWLEPEIFATDVMDGMLVENGIASLSDPLSEGFASGILAYFERAGFPWGCAPKICR